MNRIQQLISLERRVAVVTGGAGHIGGVFCEALAEIGANIVVLDISQEKCDQIADKIASDFDVKVLALAVDLADASQIKSVSLNVLEYFGRMDILVNCAAFVGTSNLEGWIAPFQEQKVETWRQALEVNLTAVFLLVQSCVEALRKSGNGSIINVASMYGIVGPDLRLYEGLDMGNPAAYAVSKGGLLQFTRWLSTVLAPDIRVNAISPGGIFRNQPEDFIKQYVARTPLKRMGTEDDLKGAVVYLAGDLSAYVTGHNLVVDGGWTIW